MGVSGSPCREILDDWPFSCRSVLVPLHRFRCQSARKAAAEPVARQRETISVSRRGGRCGRRLGRGR